MKPPRAKEVLYDSETVLRLVERELQELRNDMAIPPSPHKSVAAAPKGKGERRHDAHKANGAPPRVAGDAPTGVAPTKPRRS